MTDEEKEPEEDKEEEFLLPEDEAELTGVKAQLRALARKQKQNKQQGKS